MVWVPPGDVSMVRVFHSYLPKLRWLHSWFAGVDSLAGFLQRCLEDTRTPPTEQQLLQDRNCRLLIHSRLSTQLDAIDDTHDCAADETQQENSSGATNQYPFKTRVLVTNARGAFSGSLAEWTFAAALHFEKQVRRVQYNSENRVWDKFRMGELKGKTMGLVGFGDIGKTIGTLAKSFKMRVWAMRRDPSKGGEGIADKVFSPTKEQDLAQFFGQSDYIVSSLPGGPKTRNFIDARTLRLFRPKSFFISLGRGTVVDEDALCAALDDGAVAGAALDVFKEEPLSTSSKLWGRDNVLISAHNADWVESYSIDALNVMTKNLKAFRDHAECDAHMHTPIQKLLGY
eukprot:GHVT01020857.1.p1 GENE.GHVT01020857.1~~GHVT01020857.1.p1  ORF type:complete len:343 (+),score=46.63 GHVT01020857.1:628-1656(+)